MNPRTQDPGRFRQRCGAVVVVEEVQRAEQEYRIHALVRLLESASIADRRVEARRLRCPDVGLDDVDQRHVVALVGRRFLSEP